MLKFFVLLTSIVSIATQLTCPPRKEDIQRRLDQVLIPGAAIIAVNQKEIIYQEGFGYYSPLATEQSRRSIDPVKSIFMIASISKTFVVVAAMQLVESNRLDLDVDINQYLPSDMKITHPFYPDIVITSRHLLSHTSGIGPNMDLEYGYYVPGDTFAQADLGATIKNYLSYNQSWLHIPPGNITFYSNVGVALAAFVIERLSGMSFEQYVHEKLLKVLDIDEHKSGYRLSDFQDQKQNLVDHFLYNTSWLEVYHQVVPQLNATRADNSSDWLYIPFYGITIYPSGLLRTSAYSLSIWLRSFLNNFSTLLHSSSSIEEMLYIFPQESYVNISDGKFGLIWFWKTYDKRRLLGHTGSVPGIATVMVTNEQRNTGLIILTNGDVTRGDAQAIQVQDTISELTNELFDCFENYPNNNSGLQLQLNFINFLGLISILYFFIYHIRNV